MAGKRPPTCEGSSIQVPEAPRLQRATRARIKGYGFKLYIMHAMLYYILYTTYSILQKGVVGFLSRGLKVRFSLI